jgi:hypothetical protein
MRAWILVFSSALSDVVLGAKELALPGAHIQIQNRSALLGKLGILRKDPVLVPPRLDRVGGSHPPHHAPTDWFAQSVLGSGNDVCQRRPTQRLLGVCNQFICYRLDQRVVETGKLGFMPPSRLIFQGEVPLGPLRPPVADGVKVQTHQSRRLNTPRERMLGKQEHQAGSLPKLIFDGSLSTHL